MKDYEDIIKMDRPISKYPKMDREMRAAQFSPFSALSGYGEAICDAQKLTYEECILSEDYRSELDYILSTINKDTPLEITYFVKDKTKTGGYYQKMESKIDFIDRPGEKIILRDGMTLRISEIKKINVLMS